jgi:ATP-dependent Clp protease, protease subunit
MLFSGMSDLDTNDSDFSPAAFNPLAQKLFKARTVIISGEINQEVAERTMMQLLALAADSNEQITVYINSQGGHVEAGDTIHDMLRFIAPPVRVVGTGWVARAARRRTSPSRRARSCGCANG